MSPLLRKAFFFAIFTHIAFMVFWGGSTYISMGLGWGRKVEVNNNAVDFIAIDDDFSIGDETRIVSQGNEGGATDTPEEEEIPEQEEQEDTPITPPSENIADRNVEENMGEENAPTDRGESGSNFTQPEEGLDISAGVSDITGDDAMLVPEQPSAEPPKDEPEEEEPQDPASRLRFPIPATDVAAPTNRPSDLKNIANRIEASERPTQSGDENRAGQEGAPGENIDDLMNSISGNASEGGNQLDVRDAIVKQVSSSSCYQGTSRLTNNEYRIPVVVTLSSAGEVKNAELERGYTPSDDYERAAVDNALRAFHHPRCQSFASLNGQVEEGQQVTIIFQ